MDDSKKMVKLAAAALEEKKGENITVIDIHDISVLADYFIIADGNNASQVQAMADNVEEILQKEVGLEFARGLEHAGVFKTDAAGRAAFRRFVESL